MKYTIAVDFDGVIHSYTTPWQAPHIIPDPPVEGAIEWLWQMRDHFKIVIYTTRARTWRGRSAVRRYLMHHCGNLWWDALEETDITDCKPPALIYLDDRGWRFEGQFPTPEQIHASRPWNKP